MEFLLLEADSTEILLEDGGGSLLMETSSAGQTPPYANVTIR